jgi:hypothetical protein
MTHQRALTYLGKRGDSLRSAEMNEENALVRTVRIQRTDGERVLLATGERNR